MSSNTNSETELLELFHMFLLNQISKRAEESHIKIKLTREDAIKLTHQLGELLSHERTKS